MKTKILNCSVMLLTVVMSIGVGGFGGYYYARAQLFDQIMGNTVRQMQMLTVDKGDVK